MGAVSQKRLLSSTCFVIAGQSFHSGKFKHLKYSENVNFAGTNNFESILGAGSYFDTEIRILGSTIHELKNLKKQVKGMLKMR